MWGGGCRLVSLCLLLSLKNGILKIKNYFMRKLCCSTFFSSFFFHIPCNLKAQNIQWVSDFYSDKRRQSLNFCFGIYVSTCCMFFAMKLYLLSFRFGFHLFFHDNV